MAVFRATASSPSTSSTTTNGSPISKPTFYADSNALMEKAHALREVLDAQLKTEAHVHNHSRATWNLPNHYSNLLTYCFEEPLNEAKNILTCLLSTYQSKAANVYGDKFSLAVVFIKDKKAYDAKKVKKEGERLKGMRVIGCPKVPSQVLCDDLGDWKNDPSNEEKKEGYQGAKALASRKFTFDFYAYHPDVRSASRPLIDAFGELEIMQLELLRRFIVAWLVANRKDCTGMKTMEEALKQSTDDVEHVCQTFLNFGSQLTPRRIGNLSYDAPESCDNKGGVIGSEKQYLNQKIFGSTKKNRKEPKAGQPAVPVTQQSPIIEETLKALNAKSKDETYFFNEMYVYVYNRLGKRVLTPLDQREITTRTVVIPTYIQGVYLSSDKGGVSIGPRFDLCEITIARKEARLERPAWAASRITHQPDIPDIKNPKVQEEWSFLEDTVATTKKPAEEHKHVEVNPPPSPAKPAAAKKAPAKRKKITAGIAPPAKKPKLNVKQEVTTDLQDSDFPLEP